MCIRDRLYKKELALTGGVSFSPMERALLARLRASDKTQLLRLPDASEELLSLIHISIVCVMSGHFVQRAEPAMLTKWTRAQAAVLCGADLVLELPSRCALQSAEGFAQSAVQLLLAAGAQMLSFGSESADTGSLEQAAQLLCSPRFEPALREGLQRGLSYAAARQQALCALGGDGSLLSCPNDNLAVEYLKAAIRSGRSVTPLAALRKGAHHKDPQAQPGARFCSASALRRAWREGDRRPWDSAIPVSYTHLDVYKRQGLGRAAGPDHRHGRRYPGSPGRGNKSPGCSHPSAFSRKGPGVTFCFALQRQKKMCIRDSHDVDAVLTERRSHGRCGSCFASRNLQFNIAHNFLSHMNTS